MWDQYKKTFWGMQLVIALVTLGVYLRFYHHWFTSDTHIKAHSDIDLLIIKQTSERFIDQFARCQGTMAVRRSKARGDALLMETVAEVPAVLTVMGRLRQSSRITVMDTNAWLGVLAWKCA